MDQDLFRLLGCGVILLVGVITFVSRVSRKAQASRARSRWPNTEGVVESSSLEVVATSRGMKIELPVFAFWYLVEGERYGGRFALEPYITDPGPTILTSMIGRKVRILYDPKAPDKWLVDEALIDGCKVEQSGDPGLLLDLSPKD